MEGSLTGDREDLSMRRKEYEQVEEQEKRDGNISFSKTTNSEEGGRGREREDTDQSDFR